MTTLHTSKRHDCRALLASQALLCHCQGAVFQTSGFVQPQGIVGSAKASIDSVEAACEQVGSSRRLQGLLRSVLAVGNALNTGTARASAEGVKLDSLMKLGDVKVTIPPPHHGSGIAWPRQMT